MKISELAIKRPVLAWILMFSLIFFGLLSFRGMGVNDNPDVDYPTVSISYAYDGAPPAVIEKDIIEPVESALVSMQGIRNMTSVGERGNANITLEFELKRNIDFALQEVQTLLGRAQRQLPAQVDPPVVTKSNAADQALMFLAYTSTNLSLRELMIQYREQIRDRLSTIEGVAEIRAYGYHDPYLRVDLDANKLTKYQLTPDDIVQSIRLANNELPAGKLENGDEERLIRVMGEASGQKDFSNIHISRRGGQPNYIPVRLNDVSHVYEGIEPIRRLSRLNSVTTLGIAIQKQRGVNAVTTAKSVKKRVDLINKDLTQGTKIVVSYDRSKFIEESVNELIFTLVLSALFTSLVCLIFLGSWTVTFNILLAIPTSIIGTFIFIRLLGFTLNTFTLLGLALAIGVVVDDAIVMLENISRYMQMGYDRVNASFKGAKEISLAVLATSVALIAIFIPIGFMQGIEGRFFIEFAATISIAVAISSLEALTLMPMRCSQFLKAVERKTAIGKGIDRGIESITLWYKKSLTFALKHRTWVVMGCILFFLVTAISIKGLKSEFEPDQDIGSIFVIFLAPNGKSLEYTDTRVKQFESIVLKNPNVERVFTAVGGFGQGGQGNRGNGVIILKDLKQRSQNQFDVATDLRKELASIKGLRIILRDRRGSALSSRRGSPIEFTINGPSPDKQRELYKTLVEKMEKTNLMVNIRSDDVTDLPEIRVIPNRVEAEKRGVDVQTITDTINIAFGGRIVTQYTEGSRRFDVFVRLKEEHRKKATDLRNLFVRNNRSEFIPLKDVVILEENNAPQYIFRENRIRGIRVDASLNKGIIVSQAVNAIQKIAKETLPEGYYLNFSDTPQDRLFQILFIMSLGLIASYLILSAQFNSFFDPFIIFMSIPFGLTGAGIALLLGGQTLNIYSIIGLLLSMGLVKKNAILLVEFTNQLREKGKTVRDALLEACPIRLRPILMTTASTLAAAVPPALALGPGAETRIPMALTVLGGVSLSLVFTLYLVPCLMDILAPKRREIPMEIDDNH